MQLKGHIRMPKELESLLKAVGETSFDSISSSATSRSMPYNKADYLTGPRKVDILLMAVFYGVYSTGELPPIDLNEFPCDGSYEFSANIEKEVCVLRNILLLIWLSQDGQVSEGIDIEYRTKLYDFLETVLDDDFVTNVVFPYYSSKAAKDDGDISFIDKLTSSRYVEWKMRSHAPEYIALDFVRAREQFERKILKNLHGELLPDS